MIEKAGYSRKFWIILRIIQCKHKNFKKFFDFGAN